MSFRGGLAVLIGAALCGLGVWALAAIDFGVHVPISRTVAAVLFVAVGVTGGLLVVHFDDRA